MHGVISALVSAGLDGGYLANPRLSKVHWQAGDRELPAPRVSAAGESGLWVDPAEISSPGALPDILDAQIDPDFTLGPPTPVTAC